jgi:S1-C subfamily serine protease
MRKLTSLLSVVLVFGLISNVAFASDKPTPPRAPPVSIPEIVAVAKPAIVKIITFDAEGHAIKGGTGFFVSADGLVATNYHVIEGAKAIQIVCQGLDGADYHIEYISLTDGPGGADCPAADRSGSSRRGCTQDRKSESGF